jgi:hypothetical protein
MNTTSGRGNAALVRQALLDDRHDLIHKAAGWRAHQVDERAAHCASSPPTGLEPPGRPGGAAKHPALGSVGLNYSER